MTSMAIDEEADPHYGTVLTEEDRMQLNANIHDPQAWILSRIEHYTLQTERYNHTLRTIYNAHALIHRRLPAELLIEIFTRLYPQRRQDMHVLHTCRAWRELILKTPDFWVALLQSQRSIKRGAVPWSPERFGSFLGRSSPRNIALKPMELSIDYVYHLTAHSHRLTTLTLLLKMFQFRSFLLLVKAGMPQLEDLTLLHAYDEYEDGPGWSVQAPSVDPCTDLMPCQYSLPRLNTLQISVAFLSFPFPKHAAKCLTLGEGEGCDCGTCTCVDPDDILSFLSKCPSTETLECTLRFDPEAFDLPSTTSSAVVLPQLSNFDVNRVPTAWLSLFLSHLVLPAVRNVWFDVDTYAGEYLPSTFHRIPLISAIHHLSIDIDQDYILTIKSSDSFYLLTGLDISVAAESENLATQIAAAWPSITSLSMNISSLDLEDQEAFLPELLRCFPSLVWLSIDIRQPGEVLGTAFTPRPSDNSALCPCLKRLVITWRLDLDSEELDQPDQPFEYLLYTHCDLVASALERWQARRGGPQGDGRLRLLHINFAGLESAEGWGEPAVTDTKELRKQVMGGWKSLAVHVKVSTFDPDDSEHLCYQQDGDEVC